jgi:hypothetical protein
MVWLNYPLLPEVFIDCSQHLAPGEHDLTFNDIFEECILDSSVGNFTAQPPQFQA